MPGLPIRADWSSGPLELFIRSRAGESTCVILTTPNASLIVDAGDGLAQFVRDLELEPTQIQALVLTHDHGDHVAGLTGLLWWLHLAGRSESLPIARPQDGALIDSQLQPFPNAFPGGRRFDLSLTLHRAGQPQDFGEFQVTPFPVRHRFSSSGDWMEAYGLGVSVHDQRIVISGDSGPCEPLAQQIAGADLAIIEATLNANDDPSDSHLTLAQAETLGATARDFRLYHRR